MNRNWRICLVAVMVIASFSAWAARPENFTTIDAPGAKITLASSINGDGYVVGWYCLQAPCNPTRFRGFLRDPDGTFHDIVVPNTSEHPAIGTQPRYITPQGVVIGDYLTLEDGAILSNPRFRGFACELANCYGPNAQLTYFDAPPAAIYDHSAPHSIIPRAMNANGDLVGCIHDVDQARSMHAFLLQSDGTFTRLAESMTMNNGVTSEGDIVGFDNMSGTGYHIDKSGVVETLSFPGTEATLAWDINSKGEIVGQAFTNDGVGHAFLRGKNQQYQFIDPAGALSAVAFGIAANGNIVGQFRNASGTHGFLLQRGDD